LYRSSVLGKVDSKAMDMKISEVFVSNVYHALRVVTMPTSERDIGQFLTGAIDGGPRAGGCEEEADEHNKDDDGDDTPPRPKRRKRAAKVIVVTKLNVGTCTM
jgi:hypothetical protein